MKNKTNNGLIVFLRRSCLCLLLFVFMGTMAYGAEELYLKVGLSYGYKEVSTITISCSSGLSIGEINESGWAVTSEFPELTTVTASISNGIVEIKKEDGTVIADSLSLSQGIFPLDKSGVIYAGSDGYRGGFCFFPVDQSKMNLINYVELENYVRGVLHSEIGKSKPMETIKAQAVCARSYAIASLNTHKTSGYNVCGTTHCQVYKGYINEWPSTNQACEETKGLVIKHKGKTVAAYYSKNDGGHTDNVEDVWGTKHDYLRGVRDEFSPLYNWKKTYTFEELASSLNKAGYSVGKISSVTITQRNASGTVAKIAFWDERKQTILTASKLVSILGGNTIKSSMFSFSPIGSKDLDDALKNSTVTVENSGVITAVNLNKQMTYSKTINIIGKDGTVRNVTAGSLAIFNGKTMVLPRDENTTPSDTFTPIVQLGKESQFSTPITFYGLGWGHGVGMAQDSIIAMGKLGYDYKFMLNYFFTDITIEPWNN